MHTRRIDAALDALAVCRDRLPALREIFRLGTGERQALDELSAALSRVSAALDPSKAERG